MFGVRRPLRFLAERLSLSDDQVKVVARVLDELKVERAQAEVDAQRTVTAYADAMDAPDFDVKKAEEGQAVKAAADERQRRAVAKAIRDLHPVLTQEQRARFAHLLRTGTVVI